MENAVVLTEQPPQSRLEQAEVDISLLELSHDVSCSSLLEDVDALIELDASLLLLQDAEDDENEDFKLLSHQDAHLMEELADLDEESDSLINELFVEKQAIEHDELTLLLDQEEQADDDTSDEDAEDTEDAGEEETEAQQLDLLRKESAYLEAQWEYLRSRREQQQKKRKRSDMQQHTALLREFVTQQQFALDNMRAMLAFAPIQDVRLALMTPMESPIHLGKDFEQRRQTILQLRDDKLDTVFQYLHHKAQGLNLQLPYEHCDVFEKFGKMYCVNFSIVQLPNVPGGVREVVDVLHELVMGKDGDQLSKALGCLTIRESVDVMHRQFLHQKIRSSLQWTESLLAQHQSVPTMESNCVYFRRFDHDGNNQERAILAVDYIDHDELYPYKTQENLIRKDISSGMVLESSIDVHGQPCVLMKRMMVSKFHLYQSQVPADVQKVIFDSLPFIHQKALALIRERLHARHTQQQPSS